MKNQEHRGRGAKIAACVLCFGLSWPGVLFAKDPEPVADGEPYVPQFQHPVQPSGSWEPGQAAIGFGLVGVGAFVGGLGLYALETEEAEQRVTCRPEAGRQVCSAEPANSSRTELGAALLVGGLFASAFGIYIVATSERTSTTIIVDRNAAWDWDVVATDGGGVVETTIRF